MHPFRPPAASWAELFSGRNRWRALAVTGGVALHAVNVHIVATTLPSVVRDIGGVAWYAWSTTLFVVASILGASVSVRLLERFGPVRTYLCALGVFALGSIACASAPAMAWLLLGRGVQGLGGGVLAALSYALIRFIFEPGLWPRAIALVSGMWGIATLFGPAVGGVFADLGHWRWAFWALLPLALAQALIAAAQLPRRAAAAGADAPGARLPLGQILLLIGSVLSVAVASLFDAWSGQLGMVLFGLALGAALVRLDRRSRARLLPAGSHAPWTSFGAIYVCVALLLIGTDAEIFVPYFLQLLHGHSPLAAGYLTASMAGGWSVASLWSAGRVGRGADRMLRWGPWISAAGLCGLYLLLPAARFTPLVQTSCIALALTATGFGVGMAWPHLLTRVLSLAPAGEESLASAAITTVQLYAMSIGAALAGLVVNAAGLTEPGGLAGARSAASWLLAIFAWPPVLAALWVRRVAAAPATPVTLS